MKFWIAEFLPNRMARVIAKFFIKLRMLYSRGEFIVDLALMDTSFNVVKEHVPSLEVNTTAAR